MKFVYGLVVGIPAGGALSYLYAAKVIQAYEKAAGEIGVVFSKVTGKLTAIRKEL